MGIKNMILEVALSSDDNFVMQMGVTIISLMETNQEYFDKINVHILNNGISDKNLKKLSLLENKYEKLNYFYYDVKFINEVIPEIGKYNSAYHLGLSAYSRLFLGSLIDNIDKILYLDADTIVTGSLLDFYKQDFKDNYLIGIADTLPYFIQEKWGFKTETVFVNTGVLLINLKKWRLDNIGEKFMDTLKSFSSPNMRNDQNIINKALIGKMIISPEIKYNATPNVFFIKNDKFKKLGYLLKTQKININRILKESRENPIIIHFLGGGIWSRPWEENCNHPLTNKYLEYKNNSPWKDFQSYKPKFTSKLIKSIIMFVLVNFPAFFVLLIYRIILIFRYK